MNEFNWLSSLLFDDFNRYMLVYQSGHGDVYCNGFSHVRVGGGRFGTAPTNLEDKIAEIDVFKCDCRKWRKK